MLNQFATFGTGKIFYIKSSVEDLKLFFTGSCLFDPSKKGPLLEAVFINLSYRLQLWLRLPLKRPGSRILRAVFKGLSALDLASSKKDRISALALQH